MSGFCLPRCRPNNRCPNCVTDPTPESVSLTETQAKLRLLLTTAPNWGEAALRLDPETETVIRLPLFAESSEEYENALSAIRARIRELTASVVLSPAEVEALGIRADARTDAEHGAAQSALAKLRAPTGEYGRGWYDAEITRLKKRSITAGQAREILESGPHVRGDTLTRLSIIATESPDVR